MQDNPIPMQQFRGDIDIATSPHIKFQTHQNSELIRRELEFFV